MSDTWSTKETVDDMWRRTKGVTSTKEEEDQICSENSLKKFCKEKKKVLFISTDEERKKFAQTFKNKVAPKDLTVVYMNKSSSCETAECLGLKDKSGAVLVNEDGEVVRRSDLTDDDMKDTASLTRMAYEKVNNGKCKGVMKLNKNGIWTFEPEPGIPCDEELSDANFAKLPSGTEKYLRKHIENQPPV